MTKASEMGDDAASVFRPEMWWDLADRLRKALRISGLTAQEMADYLGVHRVTVSAWMLGRQNPNIGMMRLWAMRTGVPLEWLRDGVGAGGNLRWSYRGEDPQPTPVDDLLAGCAARDSNPEPADLWLRLVAA